MLKKTALMFAVLLAAGCARQLSPFTTGSPTTIDGNEGLLLIVIDGDVELNEVVFMGKRWRRLSKEQLDKTKYFLVALPAGKYRFAEFEIAIPPEITPKGFKPLITATTQYDEERDWTFRVEAQKISFAGYFRIQTLRLNIHNLEYYGVYDAVNRSSFAYDYMKSNFKDILDRYPMVYTGFGEDTFFEELARIQKVRTGVKK